MAFDGSNNSNSSVVTNGLHRETLVVSNLRKGKYQFQVLITGPNDIRLKSMGEINVLSGKSSQEVVLVLLGFN